MRKKLKLNKKYKMASGYSVIIIAKGKNENENFFIGESDDDPDQNFFKFDKTGMPFVASNSQIYEKL